MATIAKRLEQLEAAKGGQPGRVYRITSYGQSDEEIEAFLTAKRIEMGSDDLLINRCIINSAGRKRSQQSPLKLR